MKLERTEVQISAPDKALIRDAIAEARTVIEYAAVRVALAQGAALESVVEPSALALHLVRLTEALERASLYVARAAKPIAVTIRETKHAIREPAGEPPGGA